jgi:hypothetical protein
MVFLLACVTKQAFINQSDCNIPDNFDIFFLYSSLPNEAHTYGYVH